MKLKTAVRQNNGGSLRLGGMSVVMSDGWRGTVEQIAGGIVVCIGDGQRPNDHWCGNYRLVAPSSIRIEGSKIAVAWKSAARSVRTRKGSIGATLLDAVVVDFNRARLEREWKDAPEG